MQKFSRDSELLSGARRLKFTTSSPGIVDLTSRGWIILAQFGPMLDGLTYTLLGQREATVEEHDKTIAALRAELAAKDAELAARQPE